MGEPHEVIDLSPSAPGAPDGGVRSRAVLVALAVVAALAAATLLLVPDGDAEVAVEEDDATTTTTTTEADDAGEAGTFPTPLALGAPDDGKDSVGLPVRAEPSTGLVDGQTVRVTGTGFPPGESVGVVMCAKEAGRDHGARGAEACNLGRFAQVTASSDGVASVDFEVRRLVSLDGQEIDCASEAQRCLIGMGLISDYDQSGGVLVDFDAGQPLPDPPTATIEGEGPFDDGELVRVRVDGLLPGTGTGAAVCATDGSVCADSPSNATVGADGSATFDLRLWRVFSAPAWDPASVGRDVDCAVIACQLQPWGESSSGRAVPVLALAFTDGPIDRVRPVLQVRSEGPYRPGDRIEASISDVGRDAGVDVLLCGPDACAGGLVELDRAFGGTNVRLTVPSAADGNPCVGVPCRLVAHVYAEPSPHAPPPLAPAPVDVVIEG